MDLFLSEISGHLCPCAFLDIFAPANYSAGQIVLFWVSLGDFNPNEEGCG